MNTYNMNQFLKKKMYGESLNSQAIKSVNGNNATFAYNMSGFVVKPFKYGETKNSADICTAVYFGNGSNGTPTTPSASDYTLNSYVPIDIYSATAVRNNEYGTNGIFDIVVVVENRTSSPITLCELGLFFINEYFVSSIDNDILLLRETFDAVTLQPNETRSFTINFM